MPEQLSPSEKRASLFKYATFCLSQRPYFEEVLRQKLIKRSKKLKFVKSIKIISDILQDLKKAGYLDDPYLAQAYARRQLSKSYGPRIICLKLKRLHLSQSTIDLALAEADDEKQFESIKKYAQKHPKFDKYKLTSQLYARGFRGSSINKLFDVEYLED